MAIKWQKREFCHGWAESPCRRSLVLTPHETQGSETGQLTLYPVGSLVLMENGRGLARDK